MEFYTYDKSPFNEEPIDINEYIESVVNYMKKTDTEFDSESFRQMVEQMDQEMLKDKISAFEQSNHMRYNNKEWLEETIEGNVEYLMNSRSVH